MRLGHDQRPVGEPGEQVQHLVRLDPAAAGAHRLRRLQRPAPGEDREPGEEGRAPGRPGGRSSSPRRRAASGGAPERRAAAAREQPEAVLQPGEELLHGQDAHPRGRQLEGQGDAVQAVAELGHGRRVRRPSPRNAGCTASARSTKSRTASYCASRSSGAGPARGRGHGERRHGARRSRRRRPAPRGWSPARAGRGRPAAGRRPAGRRRPPGARSCPARGAGAWGQQRPARVPSSGRPGSSRTPSGRGDRLRHERRVGQRRQLDQPHPVRVRGRAPRRAACSASRVLPDPAGAGQGQQAGGAQQPPHLGQLPLPPHEAGELQRRVGRAGRPPPATPAPPTPPARPPRRPGTGARARLGPPPPPRPVIWGEVGRPVASRGRRPPGRPGRPRPAPGPPPAPQRLVAGGLAHPPLQITHPSGAEPGPLRQGLLGQPRGHPVLPEQGPEPRRRRPCARHRPRVPPRPGAPRRPRPTGAAYPARGRDAWAMRGPRVGEARGAPGTEGADCDRWTAGAEATAVRGR